MLQLCFLFNGGGGFFVYGGGWVFCSLCGWVDFMFMMLAGFFV